MKILLMYLSPNKTTEKISFLLKERLTASGHTVICLNIGKQGQRRFEELPQNFFDAVDLIGFGSPVFHMRILEPMQHFLGETLPALSPQTRAFIYLTYGGITTGKAFLNTLKLLQNHQIPLVGALKVHAPHFYQQVEFPDPAAVETVNDFCTRLSANHFATMPWGQAQALFSYQTRAVNMVYPLTPLISHIRKLPIDIDEQKCKRCKKCCNECPTGALNMGTYPKYDSSKCLYCYHCTTVCKQQAIICPTEKVAQMAESNKKVIGCEQPQNAVFMTD